MAQVLTVKREDVSALFVNPENGQTVFPASYERENFNPFHIAGQLPQNFFKLKTELIERDLAEKDNTVLQVIPYVVVIDQEASKFFMYQRGNGGGEDRLKKKCSIGLGGHIDIAPDAWKNLSQVVAAEALRELNEEVGFEASLDESANILEGFQQASCILFTEGDEVGTVHLGIMLMLNVRPERFGQLENNVITSGQWLTFDEIAAKVAAEEIELEAWSNLAMMHIQSMNQQRDGIVTELNAEMGNVHHSFNQLFNLHQVHGSVELVQEEWAAVKSALHLLNVKLQGILSVAANDVSGLASQADVVSGPESQNDPVVEEAGEIIQEAEQSVVVDAQAA